jgi:hypothetical protein
LQDCPSFKERVILQFNNFGFGSMVRLRSQSPVPIANSINLVQRGFRDYNRIQTDPSGNRAGMEQSWVVV